MIQPQVSCKWATRLTWDSCKYPSSYIISSEGSSISFAWAIFAKLTRKSRHCSYERAAKGPGSTVERAVVDAESAEIPFVATELALSELFDKEW